MDSFSSTPLRPAMPPSGFPQTLVLMWQLVCCRSCELAEFMSSSSKPRAVIVPGNGCPPGKVHASNWYGWMRDQLVQTGIFSEVVLRDMPDPFGAKESEWVPFLLGECGVDANTLIIGHSSGAEAAMRLMENNPVLVHLLHPPPSSLPNYFLQIHCPSLLVLSPLLSYPQGCVLVSACHTDLGIANEREAGYYNRPWQWKSISAHAGAIPCSAPAALICPCYISPCHSTTTRPLINPQAAPASHSFTATTIRSFPSPKPST